MGSRLREDDGERIFLNRAFSPALKQFNLLQRSGHRSAPPAGMSLRAFSLAASRPSSITLNAKLSDALRPKRAPFRCVKDRFLGIHSVIASGRHTACDARLQHNIACPGEFDLDQFIYFSRQPRCNDLLFLQ